VEKDSRILLLLLVIMVIFWIMVDQSRQVKILQTKNSYMQQKIEYLTKRIDGLSEQQTSVLNSLQKWLDEWDVMMSEVTGYAPLDPGAIEGMDYEGVPNLTASGERVAIGKTAAGPPDIEFGKIAYFPRHAEPRIIQDRGGRIHYTKNGDPQFDLAVATKEEAQAIGRARELVVLQK
jgi:hypothetical protein